jgi:hypothetical protein
MVRKTAFATYAFLIICFFSLVAAALPDAQDAPETSSTLFNILYTNDGRGAYEPCG